MRCENCGSALIVHGDCITCNQPLGPVAWAPLLIESQMPPTTALYLDDDVVAEQIVLPVARKRAVRRATAMA